MAEYKIEYTDKADRLKKVKEQEGLGRQMLHDDFLPTGNVMTFIDPIPPTPEEVALKLAEEAEARDIQLIIEKLPNTGINRAWKRLIKKGILP